MTGSSLVRKMKGTRQQRMKGKKESRSEEVMEEREEDRLRFGTPDLLLGHLVLKGQMDLKTT